MIAAITAAAAPWYPWGYGDSDWMAGGGFELIDVTYDKMPAFIAERTKAYLEIARMMGLAK